MQDKRRERGERLRERRGKRGNDGRKCEEWRGIKRDIK